MATSGTYNFNYTRDQIIASAARKVGAIAAGEALPSGDNSDFSDQLNIMVKGWDATGIHIWTETEATLFLQGNQVSYVLGGATTDHAALTYNSTTTASQTLNGAGSITVASIASMNNGDTIGIVMDNGLLFWTTISGAPSGVTVNLAATITDSSALGNPVYFYTASTQAIVRPLRVVSARRLLVASGIETPMDPPMSRLDYRALPNKTTTGVPTRFFYDPRGGANTQGIIYVWPEPTDTTNFVNFTWLRPIQDFDNPGDNPDLPNEWLNAIIWNLAYQMAPEYDCSQSRFAMIEKMAQGSLDLAMGFDREPESYYFGFNADQTGP